MQMQQPKGRVAYEPSSLAVDSARESRSGFRSFAAVETVARGCVRAESFADHFSQARTVYRSQSRTEQAHMATALVFELFKVATLQVREAIAGHLLHVNTDLAKRVADGLALPTMPAAPLSSAPVKYMARSSALQRIGKMKDTLEGRCIAVRVNDGSDGKIIAALKAATIAAGAQAKIVAPKVGGITLIDGSMLPADGQLAGTPSVLFDAVAVVLSKTGAQALSAEAAAIDFVRDAFGHLKAVALYSGGQALFKTAGLAEDRSVLSAANTGAFIAAAKTRQWDRDASIRMLA